MGYVFISYSTRNTDQAGAMRSILQEQGVACWMAPENIPVGSSYAGEITRAIKGSSGLVLILTDAAQSSKWVYKEVERAISYGKTVIPVALEPIVLNDNFELYLGSQQIVSVGQICLQDEVLAQIIRRIRQLVAAEGESAPDASAAAIVEAAQAPPVFAGEDDPALPEEGGWIPGKSSAAAWFRLGRLYLTGRDGYEKDEEEAFFWIEKAAQAGHPAAGYYLAWLYRRGTGTLQDPVKAAAWFARAAEAGIGYAFLQLGEMYEHGEGVEKDLPRAREMYEKAKHAGVQGEERLGSI